ncbi:MAG: DegT/DnrJ/EryC1/StrS family aminotransferase [Chloroflexota bacterium]
MAEAPAVAGGKPVRADFLVFGSPLIGEEEIQEVVATLRSGWLGTGPRTRHFEDEFRRYVSARHAVALSSCTAGLHLALDVVSVRPGDLVVTTPLTFAATANVIVHLGARPVFVDVDRRTFNLDPNLLEQALRERRGERLRAIVPVHMAGRPCDMDAILTLARRYDVAVVEDAAHAVEARWGERKVGSIGDITAFSFYVTKNICTGEGGMVTTERDDWAEEMRLKSLHGLSRDAWKRYSAEGFQPYETVYPGYKYNMTDMQAALGLPQLARVEANLAVRERHWRRYDAAFADLPAVGVPWEQPGIRHARHLYTILLDLDRLRCTRDEFITALKAENVGTGVHFTALHLHRFYRETFGHRPGDFPNAEWIGERTVSLPLSAKLSDADVADVITAVRKVVAWYRR